VKIKANTIVKTVPYRPPFLYPCIKEWWAKVTVNPDDNNIMVLSKGSSNGFTESIPLGGHWPPISTAGDRALWKNVQNMAKKKQSFTDYKQCYTHI